VVGANDGEEAAPRRRGRTCKSHRTNRVGVNDQWQCLSGFALGRRLGAHPRLKTSEM